MKNKLRFFFVETGWYFLPLVIFWLATGLYVVYYSERNGFLWLNSFHSTVFDHPILWLTELSGGYIVISIFVFLYARSRPAESLFAAILVFVTWYAAVTIKYNHFPDWKSPDSLFQGKNIHFLGSRQLQPELNFPSSQAAVITALFLFAAWLYRRSESKVLVAVVIAMLLMYTRIYVGWAYPGDILSGSLLGALIAIPMILWFLPKTKRWYDERSEWWQKMLIAILRTAAICTIIVNLKDLVL